MASRTSVFEMVHSVLVESKEKLASQTKTASAISEPKKKISSAGSQRQGVDFLKIADACDHLAKHIHLVNDERTPHEKLAEYAAVKKAIEKKAFDVGNTNIDDPSLAGYQGTGDKGGHQEEEAPGESQPPKSPPLDSGAPNPGGPDTAMKATPAMTPGDNSAEAGQQGESTDAHQTPENPSTTEKANPMDAANAMETNLEMMMPEQPTDVLKQAAKSATFRRVWGVKDGREKVAAAAKQAKQAIILLQKAAQSGVPRNVAVKVAQTKFGADITKIAEDALYPAQISAGTEPELQSDPGTPSALMQGSEAGVNTPREAAPNTGEGSGRQNLSSNESAINLTKGQAKSQNKGALAEVLTEPALSSAHDKTLDQSLDNTSSAGVKISAARTGAARELLRKFLETSPENAQKVASLLRKKAQPDAASVVPGGGIGPSPGEMTAVPDETVPASEPSPMPEGGLPGELPPELAAEGEETPEVSDEALQAAEAGVTPEELAQAEQLLAMQGLAGETGIGEGAEESGAEEEAEKGSQGMGMSPSMGSSQMSSGAGGGMSGGLGMA
jgi:hypothetical protein